MSSTRCDAAAGRPDTSDGTFPSASPPLKNKRVLPWAAIADGGNDYMKKINRYRSSFQRETKC